MRTPFKLATFVAAVAALTVGAAPFLAAAADHLDAPALGGLTNAAGDLAPHSEHGDRDINDVYVFQGSDPSRTVLAMTTNPAINLFGGHFGTNVRYQINVDKNGDAIQDLAYVVRFGMPDANGNQRYAVTRYTGVNARTLAVGVPWASGSTAGSGIGTARGDNRVFAGVRSDPFFFDLTGFLGSVKGIGTDCLGCNPTDFFTPLNTNAIVLEVPDDQLATHIGVWGRTSYWNGSTWVKADQMGRPAINTVFNGTGADKNDFNATEPSQQRTAFGGKFRTNIISTLEHLGGYGAPTAGAIANLLLPDVITYDTTTTAAGPLNGRGLADDVIDVELNLVTQGAVPGDGVGPHGDYRSSFPYLGLPH
jgi:hypothetical protein